LISGNTDALNGVFPKEVLQRAFKVLLCLVTGSFPLHAACAGPGSAREAVPYADSIFVGRVLSTTVEHDIEEIGDSFPERLRARFVITERFPSFRITGGTD
jgi:hypothetical protein